MAAACKRFTTEQIVNMLRVIGVKTETVDVMASDGAMDNLEYIDSLTTQTVNINGTYQFVPPIDYAQVPQEAKDAYRYQTGRALDAIEFGKLNLANQYHALMPSGYPGGWAKAFQELNITASAWTTMPLGTAPTTNQPRPSFNVPPAPAANGILTIDDIRSNTFYAAPSCFSPDFHRSVHTSTENH